MRTTLTLYALILFSLYAIPKNASALDRYPIDEPLSVPLTATYSSVNVSACGGGNDGAITVTPAGGLSPYTYSWTGSGGYTQGNTSSVTNLPVGYYHVTITDAGMNTVTISNIHIGYAFSVSISYSGSISGSCGNTGSIILYGNAGIQPYSYSLDGTTYQAGNTFSDLAPGSYTAYVKDAANCVNTKPIIIGVAASITVFPFPMAAGSCANDGSIEIYKSGGIPPFSYSLDNITYQASNKFLNLAAGNYTCYVKDSKDCIGSQAVAVTQGSSLTLTAGKTNTSTCINDGTIQVNPGGGMAPYNYSLNAGPYQAGNSFSGLAAGNYVVSVKDTKGCLGSVNVNIALSPILVTANVVGAESCTISNGSIQLFRTGGFGPYTYSLDGNTYQTSCIFSNISAGRYTGFVKDSRTCIGALMNIQVAPMGCDPSFTKNKNSGGNNGNRLSSINSIKVQAYPNPTTSEFLLRLEGNDQQNIFITVTDVQGRKISEVQGNITQEYKFGKDLKPGIYIIEVVQGQHKQISKLVKE